MPAAARNRNTKGPAGPRPDAPASRPRWAVAAWAVLVVAAALALFFLWPWRSQASLRRIEGQNVLLITIDTLRADALGCYGGPAATPALDRLARRASASTSRMRRRSSRSPRTPASSPASIPSSTASATTAASAWRRGSAAATLLQHAGMPTAAFIGGLSAESQFGLNQGFDIYDDRSATAQPLPISAAGAARRRGRARHGDARGSREAAGAKPGSPGCTCSIRTRRIGRRAPFDVQYASAVPTPAKSPRWTRALGAAADDPPAVGAADAGHRHRRPRRGARRSRRADARTLRL